MQLPRLFTKEVAEASAAGAEEAAGARAAKPVEARAEMEGEEIKKLAGGAAWRWGEPADGTGWYRQVTIREKEGGGRKGSPTPPSLSYVWVGGETAKWSNVREGGNSCCVFVFVRDERPPPPPAQKLFPPQALLR